MPDIDGGNCNRGRKTKKSGNCRHLRDSRDWDDVDEDLVFIIVALFPGHARVVLEYLCSTVTAPLKSS